MVLLYKGQSVVIVVSYENDFLSHGDILQFFNLTIFISFFVFLHLLQLFCLSPVEYRMFSVFSLPLLFLFLLFQFHNLLFCFLFLSVLLNLVLVLIVMETTAIAIETTNR